MELCDQVVTVYNARVDPRTREAVFAPTVLRGVSCRGEAVSGIVEGGLKAANRYVVRIPGNVDSGGKAYAEPEAYLRAAEAGDLWTLRAGDAIVRGEAAWDGQTPARLRQRGLRVATVLGVSDNRRAPRGGHWKVTGA